MGGRQRREQWVVQVEQDAGPRSHGRGPVPLAPAGRLGSGASAVDGVAIWLASRVALVALVLVTSALLGFADSAPARYPGAGPLSRFVWWDSFHFLRIADHGYFAAGMPCCDQAYFPGYPLAVRALEPVAGNGQLSGLLVSLLGGVGAAAALAALVAATGGSRRAGRTAVLLLATAPYGVFLTAVYSESLFLATALGAWWAGRRGSWWLAGLLAALATSVRINGLFLTAGLATMYALQARSPGGGRRLRTNAAALLAPLAVAVAYAAYLHTRTGGWNAWRVAEEQGWHRVPAAPWHVLAAAYRLAEGRHPPQMSLSYRAEIAFTLAGLALLLALLVLRRLPEAVYLGLSLGVLLTSTPLTSVPRYALSWFPAYLLLAELAERPRWRWLPVAALTASAPLEGALAVAFAAHAWVA